MLKNVLKRITDYIKNETEDSGQDAIIDRASAKVCKFCRKSNFCWTRNFNTTYDAICKIQSTGETPPHFLRSCIKLPLLREQLGVTIQTPIPMSTPKPKVIEANAGESRKVVGLYEFETDLEGNLTHALMQRKIYPGNVVAIKNADGRIEIDLTLKRLMPTELLISICESACARPLRVSEITGTDSGRNHVRIVERPKFSIEVGAAAESCSQSGSGDNYSFMKTENGKAIITLSDGMGSGLTASKYSSATVELMQRFLHAQLPKSLAVNLMNSVLMLGKDADTFATVDVAIIDLFSGKTEFIKLGAASGYIVRKHSKEVEKISSTSLPAGVLDVVDIETLSTSVRHGDYIILLSDGIENPQEPWLADFIGSRLRFLNAQATANEILKKALSQAQGIADDMLVVVCEIK